MYTFEKNICEKDDEEVWKICTYPLVEKDSYFVSSYGRIKKCNNRKNIDFIPTG